MPNVNRIPASRVLLTDQNGFPSSEWFSFFSYLFRSIGGGQNITATLDFPNTAAGGCSDLTVTVPGATDGDAVWLGVPAASVPANGSYYAWVSAANTVTVRFVNNSAGALNPASGTFRVMVVKP